MEIGAIDVKLVRCICDGRINKNHPNAAVQKKKSGKRRKLVTALKNVPPREPEES
jgi:hypothetical protein